MAYFNTMKRLISDKNGATAIEYGLIVALIAMVCVTTIHSLGNVSGGYDNTSAALKR